MAITFFNKKFRTSSVKCICGSSDSLVFKVEKPQNNYVKLFFYFHLK